MAIKYVFNSNISADEQSDFMAWHTINIESDVRPKSVRRVSKSVWLVNYACDGMTSKELNEYLFKKGYFKLKKKDVLKRVELV